MNNDLNFTSYHQSFWSFELHVVEFEELCVYTVAGQEEKSQQLNSSSWQNFGGSWPV